LTPTPADAFTLGVEEEYQLIDAQTGGLQSQATQVLAGDWSGDLKAEMQQNTVEVGTRVCATASEIRDELIRLRLQAAVAADARECLLLAAGTHPFSDWHGQDFTSNAVYQQIRRDYRRLADSQNIFGLHIHVAVPPEADRAQVMNAVRWYLPHLLALTASSPYFLGSDTGHDSYRAILWRRWPRTGAPPRFASEAEFQQLLRVLLDTRRIDSPGRLYWDLRPHHEYRTLEFRIADVTPRLDDAVVAAALARGVVAAAAQGLLADPPLPDSVLHPVLGDNIYRAARDGLDAEVVEFVGAEAQAIPIRTALLKLAEILAPMVTPLGDADAWAMLPALLERGGAARRIREQHTAFGGDHRRLAFWMAAETVLGTGMDRRGEQREV
jgi:carboxylate-amine ligase